MSVSRQNAELKQKLKEFDKLLEDGPAGPRLREWCDSMIERRVNVLVVALAQTVVRTADGLYVLGDVVRNGITGWVKPIAPLDEWEQMYRRSQLTMQKALDHFGSIPQEWREIFGVPLETGPVKVGTALRGAGMAIREIQRMDSNELTQEILAYFRSPEMPGDVARIREQIQKSYDDSLSTNIAANLDEDDDDTCFGQKETQFFILVWLPCWLEYGESASELLRRSERRDLSALEQLLRLDKRVMFFPGVRQIVDEANCNRMEGSFALQADAFAGKPKSLWKRDGLKVALSKFVLARSAELSAINRQVLGPPLTRLDMFEAFHAAARDRGYKRDLTLPYDQEAFIKRLTRERRFGTAAPWDTFSL